MVPAPDHQEIMRRPVMQPVLHPEDEMRLDKYLKVTRLIKRRTVANEACDAGRVQINGKPAKASTDVKVGDKITIGFGNKDVNVEVLDVRETIHKEDVTELYRYI
jgi:ribosomal 50S subunit-recycling heat shock protein